MTEREKYYSIKRNPRVPDDGLKYFSVMNGMPMDRAISFLPFFDALSDEFLFHLSQCNFTDLDLEEWNPLLFEACKKIRWDSNKCIFANMGKFIYFDVDKSKEKVNCLVIGYDDVILIPIIELYSCKKDKENFYKEKEEYEKI